MAKEKGHRLIDWNEDAKGLLALVEQKLTTQPRKEFRDWLLEQRKLLTNCNEIELIGHMLKMDSEGMIDFSILMLKSAVENAD